MKNGVLLLFMLSAITELNGESGTEHSLACYKCHSEISWEDCDKNMRGMNCTEDFNEVCLKIKRTWQDYSNNGSGIQKTTYSRLCDIASQCTQDECREHEWECKIDCCSTNLCNASFITSPHALLIGVFLCLALEAINAF